MTKHQLLKKLLSRTHHNAAEMDAELTSALEQTAAVLVCDSSGFTKTTRNKGILHFLSLLTKSYAIAIPLIESHGGTLIKNEADNFIATFQRPHEAIACAVAVQAAQQRHNAMLEHEDEAFHLCMGIDYGKFLHLSDDIFGDAVNVAYKLGEDIAERDEILVTQSVFTAVKDSVQTKDMGNMDVGHLQMPIYRVEWDAK